MDLLPCAENNELPPLGVSKGQQKNKRKKKQLRKEKWEKEEREEERALFLRSLFRAAESVLWCFGDVLWRFADLAFCESFWWGIAENVTAGCSFLLLFHDYRRFIVSRVCLLMRLIVCLLMRLMVLTTFKGFSRVNRGFWFSLSSLKICLLDDFYSIILANLNFYYGYASMWALCLHIGGIVAHRVSWFSFYPLKSFVRICLSALGGCAFGVIAAIAMSLSMPSNVDFCVDAHPRSEEQCSVGPKKIVFDTRYRSLRIRGTNRRILFRTRPSSPFLDVAPPRGSFLPEEIIIETLPRSAAKYVRQIKLSVPYWVRESPTMCTCGMLLRGKIQCAVCLMSPCVRVAGAATCPRNVGAYTICAKAMKIECQRAVSWMWCQADSDTRVIF
jgi:hypothetical protein